MRWLQLISPGESAGCTWHSCPLARGGRAGFDPAMARQSTSLPCEGGRLHQVSAADRRLCDADPVVDQRRDFEKLHLRLDTVELDDLRFHIRREECAGDGLRIPHIGIGDRPGRRSHTGPGSKLPLNERTTSESWEHVFVTAKGSALTRYRRARPGRARPAHSVRG
jgi:hypothetical protein